ncbi:MAG: histidine kinase, partial [Flavobacteriales bacterium]|nr:histidine kinase [Flavobacteriales bacterium]
TVSIKNKKSTDYFNRWNDFNNRYARKIHKISDSILIASEYSRFTELNLVQKTIRPVPDQVFLEKIVDWTWFDSKIYVSTADQIKVIDPFANKVISTFRTESTVVSISCSDSIVFGLSETGRIYRFQEENFNWIQLPEDERVFRYLDLIYQDGTMYVSTNYGVYAWSYNTREHSFELLNLDKISNVIKLSVTGNSLYYTTKKKIFKKSLNKFQKIIPTTNVHSLKVNNQPRAKSDRYELSHWQNQIEFTFESISLSHPIVDYRYRLIGHDLKSNYTTQNTVAYSSLNPGSYTFRYAATTDGFNYSIIRETSITILPPFWQKWWFYLSCGTLILTLIYLIYRFRLRQLTAKIKTEKTIAKLKSQALTAQLNPHLIFNVLNSIQGMVSDEEIEKSNIYISKFSRFMRLSLKLFKRSTVSCSEEVEITKQYVELEKLRFQDQIEFTISTIGEIQAFSIPPLITQPLIENAIKHGLMGTDIKGNIKVDFVQQDNVLTITITDNGIGFNNKIAEGDGIRITKERIKLLSQNNDLKIVSQINPTIVQLKIVK